MNEDEYLQQRLDDQSSWYDRKSQWNQQRYKRYQTIQITSAALIPVLAGLHESVPYSQVIVSLLGVLIAICVGLSGLNKYQENWLAYRTTAESLKHEKFLFMTRTTPYDGEDAFAQLVARVEGLISKENSQWATHTKKKTAT